MAIGFITPGTRHRFKRETVNTGAYNLAEVGPLYGWGTSDEDVFEGAEPSELTLVGSVDALWKAVTLGYSWASSTSGGADGGSLRARQHALFIAADSTLWGIGYNFNGNLGLGDQVTRSVITQLDANKVWAEVAADGWRVDEGASFSIARRNDGSVWTCGANSFGQLGLGDNGPRDAFAQVSLPGPASLVRAGAGGGLAIVNGVLYGWGRNRNGILADGTTTNSNTPVAAQNYITPGGGGSEESSDWVAADKGGRVGTINTSTDSAVMAAVKSDGTLWTCGAGGVQSGGPTGGSTLDQVGTDTDWVDVVLAGEHQGLGVLHALALKSDGTLWAWGIGLSGQLGNGGTTNQGSPVQVGSDTDWVAMGAELSNSWGLKTNGTLWNWGGIASSSSPVQVGSIDEWARLAVTSDARYVIRQVEDA